MLYFLAAIIAIVIAGVVGINRLLAPPSTPPPYTGERPIISDDPSSYVSHTEETVIDLPIDQYIEWSINTPLEAILPGGGAIPSVLRTEMIQGTWGEVGARRRVVLSDGHYAAEEIIVNDPPHVFRYQVWDYTNYVRFAVDYAIGEFRTEEIEGQTHITWTYSFHRNSLLSDVFLPNFVDNDWAAYMCTVLQTMKRESERIALSK
jgi:hypothetical protein